MKNSIPSATFLLAAMIDTPSRGPSGGGGAGLPDVPALTLDVFFRDGKVFSFKVDR